MAPIVSIDQLKADLRLGSGASEDELLNRLLAAAQRRCEAHIGRKVDDDPMNPLSEDDLPLVAQAVSVLAGAMYRSRDDAGDTMPAQVKWLLDPLRAVGD